MARAESLSAEQEALYERDFCLWLEQQAAALREGRLDRLDVVNLREEIEDMGRSERKSVKSNLVIVLLHLLKHQFQPRRRTRSWQATIIEHRQRMRDDLRASPSLERYARSCFAEAYSDARERAIVQTGLAGETFPEAIPYTLEQVLDPSFMPE